MQLIQTLDLDLRPYSGRRDSRRFMQRGLDAAGRDDVVFFDQNRIEKPDTVVGAAAHAYRVFLGNTQAGEGLARIDDLRPRARCDIDKASRRSRHGRQQLQEI